MKLVFEITKIKGSVGTADAVATVDGKKSCGVRIYLYRRRPKIKKTAGASDNRGFQRFFIYSLASCKTLIVSIFTGSTG